MKVKFSRCQSNSLAQVPQVDGQLIFVKDTQEIHMDVSNSRVKITDIIFLDTITERSQLPSVNYKKLYYVDETGKLYKPYMDNNELKWKDLSGASEAYADQGDSNTLQSAESYADTNFLKKTNTTAFTPTGNYQPATKKYVDDNAVTFKPFPNTFVTNSTTRAFLTSIENQNLPVGMAYLGQVSLSDMPSGVTIQAEVEVYIYPQNVIYCIMRSAEVSPYVWECNSYEFRGWEHEKASFVSFDNTGTDLLSTNVEAAIKELNAKIGSLNSIVDEIIGEEI